jgi:hypothetical protein
VDAYALVLSEPATRTLVTATRAEQRRLAVILDQMKADPFRQGDLRESDAQGRVNEVVVAGEWIVTYWPDHAVRELRIIRLEQVEA